MTQSKPTTTVQRGKEIAPEQKKQEIEQYLREAEIDPEEDHLAYWYRKQSVHPTLAKLAKKYLCVPASSVYSERLFSEYSDLYENNRNLLRPDIAEKLLFLHQNWSRLDKSGRKPSCNISTTVNQDRETSRADEDKTSASTLALSIYTDQDVEEDFFDFFKLSH